MQTIKEQPLGNLQRMKSTFSKPPFFFLIALLFFSFSGNAQQSENVVLLGNWNDTFKAPSNRIGQHYNDVWGFVQNGKEYAVIGSSEGAHIVDVETAKDVAFAKGFASGINIVHRDYKTYKNFLYAVSDEGISALQVYDLKYLPDSLHLVYQSNPFDFANCHNIFIDSAKGKLYAASVKDLAGQGNGMRVYSLANPELPELMTRYTRRTVHDVFVRNDTAYCSEEGFGLSVVDFSANDNTFLTIGELSQYDAKGYNHSSWVREDGIGVMADETHGLPLKVIDTKNLLDIQVLSTFAPRYDSTTIPHNPFIKGNYVFISYYIDGLQIYDITDPSKPLRSGYYDTYPAANYQGFNGAWGCYPFLPSGKVLVSDMQTGLYIFDVSKAAPEPVKTTSLIVYPNPAFSDFVNLRFPNGLDGKVALSLYDITGRKCLQSEAFIARESVVPVQLSLPRSLAPGMYFLSASSQGKVFSAKILKL